MEKKFSLFIEWSSNGIYHSHGISNLNNDFKNEVLIDNYPMLFICNFIFVFMNNNFAYNFL